MAAQTPVPGCSYHPGMGFILICNTCDNELLCTDCVVSRHNTHNIGKLTDYVSEQKEQIRQYEEKLSKIDIPRLKRNIQENEENFNETNTDFIKLIEDVKCQGDNIKTEADNLVDKLVTSCKVLMRIKADITENNQTALTKLVGEKLKPQLERCQQVSTSGTNTDVISVAHEIRNTSSSPPELRTLKTAHFRPGVIYNALLERMLGTVLVDGENALYNPVPSSTVVSRFKTSFPYNVCHACLLGDEAWLSYWKDEKIYRVDQKGNIKEKIKCKVKVDPITVSPTTGRVWFGVKEDNSIREVMSKGDVVTHFSVDVNPWSLCITQEDLVVVGMFERIAMFTSDGRAVTDGAGHVCTEEVVLSHQITYCRQTGDIAAADNDNVTFDDYMAGKEPGKVPRIIVMDKHLKLKFTCEQKSDIELQASGGHHSKFYPRDVCFDSDGNVLVVARVTQSVMLIDGNNGRFLKTVYIPIGIEPLCVCLQDDCTLWVGHRTNEMKLIKYR